MHPTQATTECYQQSFDFQGLGSRRVEVDFSGGHLSSDGGCLLLREMDRAERLCEQLAECFTDRRDQRFVEHDLTVMLRQRILALALGYEDINDHDSLRTDPLLAAMSGRADVLGAERHLPQDKGRPLAGKSTLNRLELGAHGTNARTKKIAAHADKIEALLLRRGVAAIPRQSKVIILDFDATDDPVHGRQEGRFFHGYYDAHCYLPLYCFCGDIPLWAQLRTADRDGSDGTLEALQKIIPAIRQRFGKHTAILVRGDSGFCREPLMAWIEAQPGVHYIFGLARNSRLEANPRHIVTDLTGKEEWAQGEAAFADGQALYEAVYCARGDMEPERSGDRQPPGCPAGVSAANQNRIKEQQMDMFADRTSTAHLKSNQLRLWFSTFAHLLMRQVREVALAGTRLAKATVGTIRLQLMKIAAQVTVSVRRVHVRLCSACPVKDIFALAHARIRALA